MEKYICIHGHFYQPPRENPWLEGIEVQDSAYPYHDWNDRITTECYAPNTASRILDKEGRIIDIINNYSKISFNFGPTLLSWMEKNKPDVYQAILDADTMSRENFSGHGSAIAQIYNHMIMPLAKRRDKQTQVVWGIRDFQKRFGRNAEGMWLPETAVDLETLEVIAENDIKFTILAPHQAINIRKPNLTKWQDIQSEGIDPTMPYLCKLPSGRSITVFFYDGPISRDIAFGNLLKNGEAFAKRLLGAFTDHRTWPQIVHIATDGETYGHHHFKGDMALAYCIYHIESKKLAKITNYGEYLEKYPPTHEVEVMENTSWSCFHGIGRWRDNCGCNFGTHPNWSQAWRGFLRKAMDTLRDIQTNLYEEKIAHYLKNPWEARNDYVDVILHRSRESLELFMKKHSLRDLSLEDKVTVLKFLEMQRNVMLMYTSCGWFFDELSGIETIQVIRYASRAIQLAEDLTGVSIEPEYLSILRSARSNISKYDNGEKIYELYGKQGRIDLLRVGAHYAISSLFDIYPRNTKIYCYTINCDVYEKQEAGRLKLAIGRTRIVSDITWEEAVVSFAVLHIGDHNVNGGVRKFKGLDAFSEMSTAIKDAFHKGDVPEVIRLMAQYFESNNYSLCHLFRDRQRHILNRILSSMISDIEFSFRQIYENNYPIINFCKSLDVPPPKPLFLSAEYIVNVDLKKIFEAEEIDLERLKELIGVAKRWSLNIESETIAFVANSWVNSLMKRLSMHPENVFLFKKIEDILELLGSLNIKIDLWKAQNIFFSIEKHIYKKMKNNAYQGNTYGKDWSNAFCNLGKFLGVKVSD